MSVYTHYEYHDDDDGGKRHWTIVDALYFCTVSMSTVGYGDLTPSNPGTKTFTLAWIFVGITCVFTQIGTCSGQLTAPVTRHGAMVLERAVNSLLPRTHLDVDGDGESDCAVPRHWVMAHHCQDALTMMPSIVSRPTGPGILPQPHPGLHRVPLPPAWLYRHHQGCPQDSAPSG